MLCGHAPACIQGGIRSAPPLDDFGICAYSLHSDQHMGFLLERQVEHVSWKCNPAPRKHTS